MIAEPRRAYRFRKCERLRTDREFTAVYSRGRRYTGGGITVCVLRRSRDTLPTRLGISISRRAAATAVARNTFKRRVREVFRLHKHAFAPGWDVVVVAQREGAALTYAELRGTLLACLRRAGVVACDRGDLGCD